MNRSGGAGAGCRVRGWGQRCLGTRHSCAFIRTSSTFTSRNQPPARRYTSTPRAPRCFQPRQSVLAAVDPLTCQPLSLPPFSRPSVPLTPPTLPLNVCWVLPSWLHSQVPSNLPGLSVSAPTSTQCVNIPPLRHLLPIGFGRSGDAREHLGRPVQQQDGLAEPQGPPRQIQPPPRCGAGCEAPSRSLLCGPSGAALKTPSPRPQMPSTRAMYLRRLQTLTDKFHRDGRLMEVRRQRAPTPSPPPHSIGRRGKEGGRREGGRQGRGERKEEGGGRRAAGGKRRVEGLV